MDAFEFFQDKVVVDQLTGCWVWQKSTNKGGYGQVTVNGKYWNTHRLAYALTHGDVADGLVVRHTCHNVRCCNPDHLTIGTQLDNWKDSEQTYRDVHQSQWKPVEIGDGIFPNLYPSMGSAANITGLSTATLVKYTTNGVFDIKAYREGCAINGKKPKV